MSFLLLLVLAVNDPRPALVQLQIEGKAEAALDATRELIASSEVDAGKLGLHYLEGHLLDQLGRRAEATVSFARALTETPKLAPHARMRIALDQELLGHPEVAAGLSATLLGSDPPKQLVVPAAELLVRSVERGGDCRLLPSLLNKRFSSQVRRLIELAQTDCERQAGDIDAAQRRLVGILREKSSDLTALLAAQRLASYPQAVREPATLELLGQTFHSHRQFDQSSALLQRMVVQMTPRVRTPRDFETRYRYGRSHFWLGHYELAAQHYGDLANRTVLPEQTAQALYHRGRALELAGHWPAAADSFRRTYLAEPDGSFAGAALIGAMRIEWRSGEEPRALELYEQLASSRSLRAERARAALFLAASDIVQRRTDRAASWLADAQALGGASAVEAFYWQGRLANLRLEPEVAIDWFLKAVRRDYYHPVAQLALQDLDRAPLRDRALEQASAWASRSDRLFDAWILLGLGERPQPLREQVRGKLEDRFVRENRTQPLFDPQPISIESWPLWSAPLLRPEELLLALGVWSESAPVIRRHFPVSSPPLALFAAEQLRESGNVRLSLEIAEIVRRQVPKRVPEAFVPMALRTALHPLAFTYLIERSSDRYGIDPFLLAAVIREESKFDPKASSGASARGLTQFVITTAQRIAQKIGMGPITPKQLEQPEVAIELGAAYLRELLTRYDEGWPQTIAAYNAGEPQAQLWQSYCYADRDNAEYYTKVAFRETRNYLGRVLSSYAEYRHLYAATAASATG